MTLSDWHELGTFLMFAGAAMLVTWMAYEFGKHEGFRKGWIAGIDYERHRAVAQSNPTDSGKATVRETQESSDV